MIEVGNNVVIQTHINQPESDHITEAQRGLETAPPRLCLAASTNPTDLNQKKQKNKHICT